MYPRDIIVIGTSAGGLDALRRLTAGLPADLPASIFVVRHCSPGPSRLAEILNRSGPLPAINPIDHEPVRSGLIYVAPPDRHMLIQDGHVCTSQGPKENHSRPAIDPLFRSAARSYGARVIGVILTGDLDDGTAGLFAVKEQGGIAIVQHPDDAVYPSMPQSALKHVEIDFCLPISEMAAKLVQLTKDPVAEIAKPSFGLEVEYRISLGDTVAIEQLMALGTLSPFICPDCQSAMWELPNNGFIRFRCRMGHGHTTQSLLAGQHENIENLLSSLNRARREEVDLRAYLEDAEGKNRQLVNRETRRESDIFLKPEFASVP